MLVSLGDIVTECIGKGMSACMFTSVCPSVCLGVGGYPQGVQTGKVLCPEKLISPQAEPLQIPNTTEM